MQAVQLLRFLNTQVVMQGEVCRAGYPLEFFATYSNRSYEAVVAVSRPDHTTPWGNASR